MRAAAVLLLPSILLHLFAAGKPVPLHRPDRPRPAAWLRWLIPAVSTFVGLFVFPWLAHEGAGFWGAGVCHRIVERSFVIAGVQLPLCARCTGIYLGFLVTVVVCILRGRSRPANLPPRGVTLVLLLFLAIVGVDGVNSYAALFPTLPHLYEPHNTLRLLTGTLEGIALAGFLWPVLHLSLWQIPREERSIPNLRELGLIVAAALAVDGLVLWQPPISLYPLVALCLAGLLLALGIVNTLLVAVVARRAGRVERWPEVGTLFAWGAFVALLQMAGLAWLRFMLVGGFNFTLGL